jgi:hypothetical protein
VFFRRGHFQHQHGHPDRLDLTMTHGSDQPVTRTFDRAWLDDTAGLAFLPPHPTPDQVEQLFPSTDWRDNPVLIRVTREGYGEPIQPYSGGQPGGLTLLPDQFPCAYGGILRMTRD